MCRIAPCFMLAFAVCAVAEQRIQTFDADPHWDGMNNRSTIETRTIEQDFGYSKTDHGGWGEGEVGGTIYPDGTPAYYAKEMPPRTLDDSFTVSGALVVEEGAGNALIGFFNHKTINEWRTPNSIAIRVNGRGETFHTHVEYATSRWRTSAGVIGRYDEHADRMYPIETPSRGVHLWTLSYDPDGANGDGLITLEFDGTKAECPLAPGHKADGITVDRVGILNVVKSADAPGTLWINNIAIDDKDEMFTSDPQWDARNNRKTYETEEVRPRFNFGYSNTQRAGGAHTGEIGGLFFRGDCRYPERLAYYGDRVEGLDLTMPLHARGTLALHRGVTDSTTLFGFFHHEHSVFVHDSQQTGMPRDVLGFHVEGPSRIGFNVYPVYRTDGESQALAQGDDLPIIYPDGASHKWSLDYNPDGAEGNGEIVLILDRKEVRLALESGVKEEGATFTRFGFVTPWIDGNGQAIYLDDLEYTSAP